jgi:hypothetical protein
MEERNINPYSDIIDASYKLYERPIKDYDMFILSLSKNLENDVDKTMDFIGSVAAFQTVMAPAIIRHFDYLDSHAARDLKLNPSLVLFPGHTFIDFKDATSKEKLMPILGYMDYKYEKYEMYNRVKTAITLNWLCKAKFSLTMTEMSDLIEDFKNTLTEYYSN